MQQYAGDFFRQPSGRRKNKIPVERKFGHSGLNVPAADCIAAADRRPPMYSKVVNRAAGLSTVIFLRSINGYMTLPVGEVGQVTVNGLLC